MQFSLLAVAWRCRRWNVFNRYYVNQRDSGDTVVDGGIAGPGETNHQVAAPDQDEVRVMNVELKPLAYPNSQWAKRSFSQTSLNLFGPKHRHSSDR
jgi:hypothetical protein